MRILLICLHFLLRGQDCGGYLETESEEAPFYHQKDFVASPNWTSHFEPQRGDTEAEPLGTSPLFATLQSGLYTPICGKNGCEDIEECPCIMEMHNMLADCTEEFQLLCKMRFLLGIFPRSHVQFPPVSSKLLGWMVDRHLVSMGSRRMARRHLAAAQVPQTSAKSWPPAEPGRSSCSWTWQRRQEQEPCTEGQRTWEAKQERQVSGIGMGSRNAEGQRAACCHAYMDQSHPRPCAVDSSSCPNHRPNLQGGGQVEGAGCRAAQNPRQSLPGGPGPRQGRCHDHWASRNDSCCQHSPGAGSCQGEATSHQMGSIPKSWSLEELSPRGHAADDRLCNCVPRAGNYPGRCRAEGEGSGATSQGCCRGRQGRDRGDFRWGGNGDGAATGPPGRTTEHAVCPQQAPHRSHGPARGREATQKAQTKSRGICTRFWQRLAVYGAFWSARQSRAVNPIDCLGPSPLPFLSTVQQGAALIWSHPVVEEHDFVSPWKAIWQAMELSFSLESWSVPCTTRTRESRRPKSPVGNVTFAEDVEVCIYSQFGRRDPIQMPLDALELWEAKPWSMDVFSNAQFEEVDALPADALDLVPPSRNFNPAPNLIDYKQSHPVIAHRAPRYEFDLPGHPLQGRPAVDEMPAWIQQLWQGIFHQQSDIEYFDEGPVLYMMTWYLHPVSHRACGQSRIAKLDVYYEHWETDLRLLWHDTIHRYDDLDVYMVFPEPPRTTGAMHSGHLILTQGDLAPSRAALISTFQRTLHGNQLTQVAVVAPQRVNKVIVQQLSQVPPQFFDEGSECWVDEEWVAEAGPGVRLHDGAHVLLYIERSGAGPGRTWQQDPLGAGDDDSDEASLLGWQLPSDDDPVALATGRHESALMEVSRCGDPLSLREAVLNSPDSKPGLRHHDIGQESANPELCRARFEDRHNDCEPIEPTDSSEHPPDICDRHLADDVQLVQLGTWEPQEHKDTPDEPRWHQQMRASTQDFEDPTQAASSEGADSHHSPQDGSDQPDDPETPDDSPGDPGSPSQLPQQDEPHRQSVMLFLLGQAPIHAYIAWHNHDAMMQEIANHCLVPIHRILQLHDLAFQPVDLQSNPDLYPMVVQLELHIQPGSTEQLCLIDIEHYGQQNEPHYYTGPVVNRAIWKVPRQLVRRTLLRIIGQDEHCIRASQRCIVKMNGDVWNVQDARARDIRHGDHFCVQIPPVEDCPHVDILRAWTGVAPNDTAVSSGYSPSSGVVASPESFDLERLLDTDDSSMFQAQFQSLHHALRSIGHTLDETAPDAPHSPACSDTLSWEMPGHEPGSPPTVDLPQWAQSLHPQFAELLARQDDVSTTEIYIQTWYLSHHHHLRCDPGKPLLLAQDPHQWQEDARQLWQDLIDVNSECRFELVHPPPLPCGSRMFLAHLMISQHRDDSVLLADRRVETVVTTIFEHDTRPRIWQLALIMPSWSLADYFFHVLGIQSTCIQRRATGRPCNIIHGPNELELGIRDLFHHADSLTIHVPQAPEQMVEGVSLLQQQTKRFRGGHSADQQTPELTIDFQRVLQVKEELLQLQLPIFQAWNQLYLEDELCSFVDSLPHWEGQTIQSIEFYSDGSFKKGLHVGAAVVALAHAHDQTFILGAISQTMFGDHAYTGELCALVWALIWACQLTHFLPPTLVEHIEFAFLFDCVAAGYQSAGWWHGKLHQDWHAILRSLMQYLEARLSPAQIRSQHVHAHSGHLPNELADRIAKYSSALLEVVQPIPWLPWFEHTNITAIQWIWACDRLQAHDPTMPELKNNVLHVPLGPQTTSISAGHNFDGTTAARTAKGHPFTMRIATANVMTLLESSHTANHLAGGRQLASMQQCHEAACHIVAIQESRHRRISQNNEWYHVFGHPATPRGHAGVQLWIAKKLRFGPHSVTIQQVREVFSDANTLILKVRLPGLPFVVAATHAPHAARPHEESVAYWRNITAHINRACKGLPIFLAGDTNAHLGSETSHAIGPHGAARENGPGKAFHEWLITHEMFAPATFAQHHTGTHSTFHSIRGGIGHRLDYICLPMAWFGTSATTWTSDSIDLGLARDDHLAVCADIPLLIPDQQPPTTSRTRPIDAVHAAHWATTWEGHCALQASLAPPSWAISVHEQAAQLSQQVHQAIPASISKQKQSFRKRHLLPETQALIRTKQDLFKRLRHLHSAERSLCLQAVFKSWRQQVIKTSVADSDWLPSAIQSELQLDIQLACTYYEYGQVAPLVQQAVRRDDAAFLSGLATEAGHTFSVEGLQGLWRHVKGLLPKNRVKRDRQQADLDHAMLRHFSDLEAGQCVSWPQLHQRCTTRNESAVGHRCSLEVQLEELPSLWQVEQLCLKQKAGKCPGPDRIPGELCSHGATSIAPALHNLLLKSVLQGAEPLEFKGGRLCMIYKGKGSKMEPSKYRGILLTDVFAKIFHSWTRSQLLPTFLARARPGQLGGLPSQQTATAIHLLRLHTWNARQLHLTSGVLFIDVRAAFHHMIRDFVFALRDPLTAEQLSNFLDSNQHDIPAIAAGLQQAVADGAQDIRPLLRHLLADIHQQTWFHLATMESTNYVETGRGTRPGSPLADVGFNLLFCKVMSKIEEGLSQIQHYVAGTEAAGHDFHPVAWMDDLAIPLTTVKADTMPTLLADVMRLVHEVFSSFGLTVNMDPGKTEAVVMFRGPGSDTQRLKLFDRDAAPAIVVSTETHVLSLRVASSYRHLGARYTMDADIEHEVTARLGAARTAFHEIKKQVFHNRHIALHGRLQLLHSLIFSRLMYGCAIWTDMPASCLRKIEAQLMKMYRSIIDNGFWKDGSICSDGALRAEHELPTFRLLWAKTRLIYLHHFAGFGEGVYRAAVLQEYTRGRGWLFEIESDLNWMSELVDLPFEWPTPSPLDWSPILQAIVSAPNWKSLVRRAYWRHLKRESVAWQTETLHLNILSELEEQGLKLDPAETLVPLEAHPCDHCDRVFDSNQKLAVHRLKSHHIESDERAFIQSTVCPGCLVDHWTTRRLQQHLRHRANGCFDRLCGARPAEPTVHISLPEHLKGVKRLPARRLHHGPLRPTKQIRLLKALQAEISRCYDLGLANGAWLRSEDHAILHARLCLHFNGCWESCAQQHYEDLFEKCIQAPSHLEAGDANLACSLDTWGQDLLASLSPDHAGYSPLRALLADLGTAHTRQWEATLRQQLDDLNHPVHDEEVAPRAAPPQSRDHRHPIDNGFTAAMRREQARARQTGTFEPSPRPNPQYQFGMIVHLYSGRRRHGDFQHWAEHFAASRGLHLCVISVDTAIDPAMNVHCPDLWSTLLRAGRAGHILGLLLGPPCETWSSARFHRLEGDRGPRPLRSRERPWGLDGLRFPELEQLGVGSDLLLRGLWLSILVAFAHGAVVLEHPAPPFDASHPTIWATFVLQLLRTFCPWFHLMIIEQWRLGAIATKPTGLLYANCKLPTWIKANEATHLTPPSTSLIGRDSAGCFKTAKAKEYPSALNRALAQAILSDVVVSHDPAPTPEWWRFVQALSTLCTSVDRGCMMPDYQPKR